MTVVVSGAFTPSPAARACSDLKSDIASYVNAPNASRALAKAETFIGTAVARLNTRLWPWSLVYQDITLIAATADYTLASQFAAPRIAELLDSNGLAASRLGWEDAKTFSLDNYDRRTSGSPTTYTAQNPHEYGQVTLDVPPSASFVTAYPTLRLRYYQKIAPCSGSVTALDVPFEVAEWIAWEAKAMMAASFDPPKAGYAEGKSAQLWRDLLRQAMATQLSDWS